MGKTVISWCHFTHNLWEGCFKISPGCRFCYAEAMNHWLRGGENWGIDAPRKTFTPAHYQKPYAWNEKAMRENTRFRVFAGSVMDIAEIHPDPGIAIMQERLRYELYETILATPYLDYLFLTKRPENFHRILPEANALIPKGMFRNVWLGATVEDQEHAEERYNTLLNVPAAKHFFSYEPALGPIDWPGLFSLSNGSRLPDWIIFGDESGSKKRPADIQWARDTRDACAAAGVSFHLKQWNTLGTPGITGERDGKGKLHLPILDGVRHAGFPET